MKLGLSGCSIALCFSLGESSLLFSWGELFAFLLGRAFYFYGGEGGGECTVATY